MTIAQIINKLESLQCQYDGDVDVDVLTLLDGDWMAVSGWATDRDGEDIEVDVRFK